MTVELEGREERQCSHQQRECFHRSGESAS